jgi:hypothetical protein
MFGIIISGRPVITEGSTISPTQLAFTISSQPQFSHIVVFLLPGNVLPASNAAAVYLQLPNEPSFRMLGALTETKQSAIFRVRDSHAEQLIGDVTVGISLEPIANVEQAMLATGAGMEVARVTGGGGGGNRVDTKVLAKRIIENAFNFLASFGSDVIPLRAFQEWWRKFESRVDRDPSFLEREAD